MLPGFGCELHEGEWGAVGSILKWNWLVDGEPQHTKELIEFADENNKSITFRVLEGEIIQIYKRIAANVRADQNGENCLVTWTVEYEKINEDVPDPDSIIDFAYNLTKDIKTHHLK
ncbi:hypothetical protein CTI12_AA273680 [Artemisia annua]|uniref:Bet v I/Major latex protein domain-containing protein n=1 Tax=Artemisia annua TaxID=35608 RepID=A0A2U1NF05_ARTAN|nr:hypothetical protein CTI12_AA273680 [Artemisia annua]